MKRYLVFILSLICFISGFSSDVLSSVVTRSVDEDIILVVDYTYKEIDGKLSIAREIYRDPYKNCIMVKNHSYKGGLLAEVIINGDDHISYFYLEEGVLQKAERRYLTDEIYEYWVYEYGEENRKLKNILNYDGLGKLKSIKKYCYNERGFIDSIVKFTYNFSDLEKSEKMSYVDSDTTKFSYMESGRIKKVEENELEYLFEYNDDGKISKTTKISDGMPISYETYNYSEAQTLFDENGFNAYGFNSEGYDENGFDKSGFDKFGYDKDGFNFAGFNKDGVNKETGTLFDTNGYDQEGFDAFGYDMNKLDRNGFDKYGYNKDGFDAYGYDKYGYDKNGYDKKGFNSEGFSKNGINKYTGNIYDLYGYDRYGFNEKGFDKNGRNKYTGDIYDQIGFDKDGFDKNGFSKDGINRYTGTEYDPFGFDKNGFSKDGINRYTRTKYDSEGFDVNGFDKEGNKR